MPYQDTLILESDAPGLVANNYDCVALVHPDGSVGLPVMDKFGLGSLPPASVTRSRLLVAVLDPKDPTAVAAVRASLQWTDHTPF